MSFAWSIFADIDIGSEAIRCCGPTRFTVWGVWRTLFARDYFGSLRYIGENSNAVRVLEQRRKRSLSKHGNSDMSMNKSDMLGASAFENDIES